MPSGNAPSKLYKYRSISDRTIELLITDQVYFADPSTFNDPLDTRPSVRADAPAGVLQDALRELIQRRIERELSAAAKTIKYRGPKTLQHITELSQKQAQRKLSQISYLASESGDLDARGTDHLRLLENALQTELLLRYEKGILSLAERYSCPLMWSHYADQHKGICIGYEVTDSPYPPLKVQYGGSREILGSQIAAMMRSGGRAQDEVDAAVLLRKARSWAYEKEWRSIAPKGLTENPFKLSDVTFGLRCSEPVKFAVMASLSKRAGAQVRFYEMTESRINFSLSRRRIHPDSHDYYPKSAFEERNYFDLRLSPEQA
ncbi:DUF2971 domain-containing protein [Pseudomonas aeruginosa]